MIVAALGTHEMPMRRLVAALARLAHEQPERGGFWIQHGWTQLPAGWVGEPLVSRPRLAELMRRADIVITHGGPALISEARGVGKVPIVIPRLSRLGEHVADHQVRYAERLAAAGDVLLVADVDALGCVVRRYEELTERLPAPGARDPGPAVARFAALVDELLDGR